MSGYVVLRPEPRPPAPAHRRTVWLIVGVVACGLGALWFGWLFLALSWDMSRMYGNPNPWAGAPYALVPAALLAGCVRCALSLRHRERPGLLKLLAAAFVLLAGAAVVLGYAGDAQNSAYRSAQSDIYLEGQRDTLRGLPMNQSVGGGVLAEPMCGADGFCAIDVWVAGDSVAASLDAMTAQMEAAGWTTDDRGPASAMYAGIDNVVEATVTQEGDKGGTSFEVKVIK